MNSLEIQACEPKKLSFKMEKAESLEGFLEPQHLL